MRWLVLVLLFSGGDGRTPLMTAALMGRTNDVKSLLAAGADVKARDKEQRLAIDYASPRQHPEIMELLRKAGSPPPTGHSGRLLCDAQARLTELGYEGGGLCSTPNVLGCAGRLPAHYGSSRDQPVGCAHAAGAGARVSVDGVQAVKPGATTWPGNTIRTPALTHSSRRIRTR